MNEMIFFAGVGVAVLVLALIVIMMMRLERELKKLRQDCDFLRAQIQRSGGDVAGLCSAAIAVDKRLSDSELQVNRILDHLESHTSAPQPPSEQVFVDEDEEPQGYALAIEKIKGGSSLDELVKSCGLTRDEAVLLMRLHGKH